MEQSERTLTPQQLDFALDKWLTWNNGCIQRFVNENYVALAEIWRAWGSHDGLAWDDFVALCQRRFVEYLRSQYGDK